METHREREREIERQMKSKVFFMVDFKGLSI